MYFPIGAMQGHTPLSLSLSCVARTCARSPPDLDRVLRLEESVPTVTTRTQTTSTVASLVSRSRLSDWPKSGGRKRTSGRKVFYRGKHSSRSDTHSLVCALSQLVCERRSMENIFLATEPDHDATHLPACASRCAAKRCLKKN